MKYQFGKDISPYNYVVIEAQSLEQAIKLFKVSELFPENYVDSQYVAKDSEGYLDSDYDSDLGRTIRKFKIKNPKIFIYDENDKKIGQVGLQECIDVDFRDIMPQANLLEAPKTGTEEEPEETLPVLGNERALANTGSKRELREKHDQILKKKAELEAMTQALNNSMNALKQELHQKMKVVYILETFLGIKEQVIQICEGESATEDEPLTLYQQRLYMDEEVGIWDSEIGLDFTRIEEFDEWIASHYDRYLYRPKSVCVFRVRRQKARRDDPVMSFIAEDHDMRTYFLIRNGTNLYRIFSNVSVPERLFPGKNEYMSLFNEEKKWGDNDGNS